MGLVHLCIPNPRFRLAASPWAIILRPLQGLKHNRRQVLGLKGGGYPANRPARLIPYEHGGIPAKLLSLVLPGSSRTSGCFDGAAGDGCQTPSVDKNLDAADKSARATTECNVSSYKPVKLPGLAACP